MNQIDLFPSNYPNQRKHHQQIEDKFLPRWTRVFPPLLAPITRAPDLGVAHWQAVITDMISDNVDVVTAVAEDFGQFPDRRRRAKVRRKRTGGYHSNSAHKETVSASTS